MAEDTREANVVLTADTSNYTQQMTGAATATNGVLDSVNKLLVALDRLSKSAGRKLEIISGSTIAGLAGATMAAAKFDQQMSTLSANAAITGGSIDKMSRTVDNLRRSLPVSTEQVIALVTALSKLGATPANVEKLAATFIKLAAATGEDLGALATSMTELQRAMGTTSGSTEKFASEVAHLSAAMGVSATGLTQFAQQLAPVARMVDMTTTEVMGFSAAFLKSGQDTGAAANVFTKVITDVSRATRYGSSDIYAYANAVGMTAEAFKKLPPTQQVNAFINAIAKQGPEAIKVLDQLGFEGPRQFKVIQSLAQSGALNMGQAEAKKGFDSDALETGSKAAMSSLNDELTKLRNNLTSMAQAFGATFLPVVTKITQGFTAMASAVTTVIQPVAKLLAALGLAGGTATGVMGFALSNFGMLTAAATVMALRRNSLVSGFTTARRGANAPAFAQTAAARMALPAGDPNRPQGYQRWLYAQGQRMGGGGVGDRMTLRQQVVAAAQRQQEANNNRVTRGMLRATGAIPTGWGPSTWRERATTGADRLRGRWDNRFTQGVVSAASYVPRDRGPILPRMAMVGAAGFQAASSLAAQSVGPLTMSRMRDLTSADRNPFRQAGASFRSGITGEGASYSRAFTGVTGAVSSFTKAIGSAVIGAGRWTAAVVTGAGPAASAMAAQTAANRAAAVAVEANAAANRAAAGSITQSAAQMRMAALSGHLRVAGAGIGAAAGSVWGGLKTLGSGVGTMFGALGGAPMLGIMGGLAAYSSYKRDKQKTEDFAAGLDSEDITSPVNAYASAMGIATTATQNLASAMVEATGDIKPTSQEGAKSVTQADLDVATKADREYTVKDFDKITEDQMAARAAIVFGPQNQDLPTQQAMKLDVIKRMGGDQKKAQEFIDTAAEGKVDFGGMITGTRNDVNGWSRLTPDNFLKSTFKTNDAVRTTTDEQYKAYVQVKNATESQEGKDPAKEVTFKEVNALAQEFEGASYGEADVIAKTLEKVLGGEKLGIDFGDINKLTDVKQTDVHRREYLQQVLGRSDSKGAATFLKDWNAAAPEVREGTVYEQKPWTAKSKEFEEKGFLASPAGKIYGEQTKAGQAVRDSMNEMANTGLAYNATMLRADDLLSKFGGSTSAALKALEDFKTLNGNEESFEYTSASAAQAELRHRQEIATARTPEDFREPVRQVSVAAAQAGMMAPRAPGYADANTSAKAAVESATANYQNRVEEAWKAYDNFRIQRERSEDNFNLQIKRNEQSYALQKKYSLEDFNTSRERSEEAYNLQRERSERNYNQQKKYSQEDYDRSRHRAEKAFNHQVQVMAEQQARNITNIYDRINTQPVWDSTNLFSNAEDQLEKMKEQQKNLAEARKMGLSSDVISQLGLNEFAGAQQLDSMIDDLKEDPTLITKFNKNIKERIKVGKKYVTDEDSSQWKEMQHNFDETAKQGEADFKRMTRRSEKAYQQGMNDMAEDYTKMSKQAGTDYEKMSKRQEEAYNLAVKNMKDDFKTQMENAQKDIDHAFEISTKSFATKETEVIKAMGTTAKNQMIQMKKDIDAAGKVLEASATGSVSDIIKALAPLYGGDEDKVREALGLGKKVDGSKGNGRTQNQATGGGYGGEASHDSASGGVGGGGSPGSSVHFPLPAGSYSKTSGFGMRWGRLHAGNDYSAPQGTPIGASQDGIVTRAGVLGGLGNMVEVTHNKGLKSWYGHMSHITAKNGQAVSAGQEIGKVGHTGNVRGVTGNHLHFEIHVNGTAVNPNSYLSGAGAGAISGVTKVAPGQTSAPSAETFEKLNLDSQFKDLEKGLDTKPPFANWYVKGAITKTMHDRLKKLSVPMEKIEDDGPATGGWYGHGGIFNKPRKIGVGESGAEMVLPLDPKGADFLARTLAKLSSPQHGGSEYVRGGRTVEVHNNTYNQHIDKSTEFSGDIHVQTKDPREMMRQLEEYKRLRALTRPVTAR